MNCVQQNEYLKQLYRVATFPCTPNISLHTQEMCTQLEGKINEN